MHIHRMAAIASLVALTGAQLWVAGAAQPDSGATVSFSDNFSTGPSPLWSNSLGNWTASGGQYFAQVPNNNPTTYTLLPFNLTNYTLSVTINSLADCGIWLRANGTKENPYSNGIALILGGGGYGQGVRSFPAGTSVYFATPSGATINQVNGVFAPGQTYTITVTVKGDTYSVFVNGSTTPVTTLTDSTFSHGQVGLYDDQPNTTTGDGSGPPNTFSDFSISGSELAAKINSFSPASGPAGTKVTIHGTDLQLATAVTINGTPAKFKQSYPTTTIVATVPAGATTGPIAVTTPAGQAVSKTSFTVQ